MDFDTVLSHCGNFNRYQLILLLLYGYINILSSMHYFSQTLIAFTPEHWCYHDKLKNETFDNIRTAFEPFHNQKCTPIKDVINGTGVRAKYGSCHNWIFEYEMGYESITTELKWVCKDAYKPAVGQSFFFIGSVFGTVFFGYLADKIGRLPALIISSLSGALGDFITSFVYSLPAFAVGRLIAGLSTDTIFFLMYIMVFEYLDPKKRTFGLNIITTVFYCIGLMLSPWFAIWVGTWRYYLLITSIPVTALLLFPFAICESAQWLLTKEDYNGAVRCLKRVAAVNNRTVPDRVFDDFVAFYEQKIIAEKKFSTSKDTFWGMFRTPRLRKFTTILIIKSMIITVSFDVISRNMEGMGTSPFMLFSFTSIVYIPGGLTIILLQNVIGRKGMASGSLFVGGIITALTGVMIAFLDKNQNSILLALMIGLARYGAIVAYDAEAQYAAEIIPTSVRGRGMSNIHVVGYAFSFLSSYIIYLGTYFKAAPSIFISVLMFVGAGLCFMLPETLNKKLPETLVDGENFALDEKWYYLPCFKRKTKETVAAVEGNNNRY